MSAGVALPNAMGASACTSFWGRAIWALLVESLPPAIMTSASPRSMAAAASVTACRPLAQARVHVMPSTFSGRPRSSAISRARFGDMVGRITPPQTIPCTAVRGSSVC